jgi:pSer/pThr/pTyr-binding forkhead associated (FHA) protein
MALTLVVRAQQARSEAPAEGEGAPLSITLDAPRLVIGRGEGCDLRLPDPSVSKRHASLRQRGSEWLLMDEKSTNGTLLGGVKLAPQSPLVVRSGERVRVGRVWLEVRIAPGLAAPQPAALAKEIALELVTRALAAEGEDARPRLVVIAGPNQGKELVLAEAGRRYVIGRGREADLVLEDPDASRRHVDVGRRGDHLVVQDLGSKAGAALGDAPLGSDDTAWKAGQVLALGSTEIAFSYPAIDALAELERSPDEPMRPGEEVADVADAPSTTLEAGSSGARDLEEPEGARSDDEPRIERRRKSARDPAAWTMTDLAVVLLATGVLALSVAGLIWLLR